MNGEMNQCRINQALNFEVITDKIQTLKGL